MWIGLLNFFVGFILQLAIQFSKINSSLNSLIFKIKFAFFTKSTTSFRFLKPNLSIKWTFLSKECCEIFFLNFIGIFLNGCGKYLIIYFLINSYHVMQILVSMNYPSFLELLIYFFQKIPLVFFLILLFFLWVYLLTTVTRKTRKRKREKEKKREVT